MPITAGLRDFTGVGRAERAYRAGSSRVNALGVLLTSGVLTSGLLAAGCTVTPPGASDAHLAQAKSRAAHGAAVFESACASCHGPRGEGLAGAPAILGVTGLPRYPRDQAGLQLYQDPNQVQRQNQDRVPGVASRPEFVTAQDVQDYVKQHLGKVKDGASDLSEDDSWAVITFLLIAHGSNVPGQEISAANARDVAIRVP